VQNFFTLPFLLFTYLGRKDTTFEEESQEK